MINLVNENEFKDTVKEGIVVADFYATWCGPCKMLSPVLENLSVELDGLVRFVKVDVDQDLALANEYKVAGVPTMVVFKDGEPQESMVGFLPGDIIVSKLEKYM